MIKLLAESNGERHELKLEREGLSVKASVDDRSYTVEFHKLSSGDYLLRSGTQVYVCRVEANVKQPEALHVNLRKNNYAIQLIDPKRSRRLKGSGAHDDGSVQIIAPMPGKVVRVLVEAGAEVEAGAGIVVVEAMKMQNEMKSPKAGLVVLLNAEPGATVNAGDVLAEIE